MTGSDNPLAGLLAEDPAPDAGHHQHYLFAHRLLPQLFLSDPRRFLGAWDRDGDGFLEKLWEAAGDGLPQAGRYGSDGLAGEAASQGDARILVVTLPAPRRPPEAIFVAAIYRPAKGWFPRRREIRRYVTLERGVDLDGGRIAVLCEWTAQGSHQNMGDRPIADRAGFLGLIREMIPG